MQAKQEDEQASYAHYQGACNSTKDPWDLTLNCWLRFAQIPTPESRNPTPRTPNAQTLYTLVPLVQGHLSPSAGLSWSLPVSPVLCSSVSLDLLVSPCPSRPLSASLFSSRSFACSEYRISSIRLSPPLSLSL